jgi:hypothetical protein
VPAHFVCGCMLSSNFAETSCNKNYTATPTTQLKPTACGPVDAVIFTSRLPLMSNVEGVGGSIIQSLSTDDKCDQ